VIIPQFGGFVTNERSAVIDKERERIHPPYKQITFNNHLKNNDGLLANYISSVDKISYDCALNYIKFEVESWMEKLREEDLELSGLGTFSSVDGKLQFEPQKKMNYLLSSFGLSSVAAKDLHASVETEKVVEAEPVPVVPLGEKKTPAYLKYAAVFVLGLSAIGFGAKLYQDYKSEQWVAEAQKQQMRVEQKIENATFVISKPLPALSIELESQKKSFHVIAGAFRYPDNAERKVNQLLDEGYEARILGVNRWNLTVVSYGSYKTREEALLELDSIQKYVAKDSWLLIQEF
jgi:hypothetical protein